MDLSEPLPPGRPQGHSGLFVWLLAIAVVGAWMAVFRIVHDFYSPPAPEPTHAAPQTPGLHVD